MNGQIESIHKLPWGQFASFAFDKKYRSHCIYFHCPVKSFRVLGEINFEYFHYPANEVMLLEYLADGAFASTSCSVIKIFDFQGKKWNE